MADSGSTKKPSRFKSWFKPNQASSIASSSHDETEGLTPRNDLVLPNATIHETLSKIITDSMPCPEIVAVLTAHGCDDLTSSLDESACSKYPITSGGLGDVFSGRLHDGTSVAIKTLRTIYEPGREVRMYQKRAAKEIYTWSKCKHPNIVQLIGLAVFHDCLAMVSCWEANGNLLQYLSCHPSANRCHLSTLICAGLAYLHDNDIVHGDLKGANVLISQAGTPMLMDFGNAILRGATLQFTQTNTGPNYSLRWTAPEMLAGKSFHTTTGDVYSLGMTILEAFTSEIPFAGQADFSLVLHIAIDKKTPTRPEKVIPTRSVDGDRLWAVLTKCWSYDPEDRPDARAVWDAMKPMKPENLKEIEGEDEGESEDESGRNEEEDTRVVRRKHRVFISSRHSSSANSRRSSVVSITYPIPEGTSPVTRQRSDPRSMTPTSERGEFSSRPSSVRSMSVSMTPVTPNMRRPRHPKSPSNSSAGSPLQQYHRRAGWGSSTKVVRQVKGVHHSQRHNRSKSVGTTPSSNIPASPWVVTGNSAVESMSKLVGTIPSSSIPASPWVVTGNSTVESMSKSVDTPEEGQDDTLSSLPNFPSTSKPRQRASLLTAFRTWFQGDRKKRKDQPAVQYVATRRVVSTPTGSARGRGTRPVRPDNYNNKRRREHRVSISSRHSSSANSRRSSVVSMTYPIPEGTSPVTRQRSDPRSMTPTSERGEFSSRPSSVRSMSVSMTPVTPSMRRPRHSKSPSNSSAGSGHPIRRAQSPLQQYHRRAGSGSSTKVVRQVKGVHHSQRHNRSNSAASSIRSVPNSRPTSFHEGFSTFDSDAVPTSYSNSPEPQRRTYGQTSFVAQKKKSGVYAGVARTTWKKSWGIEPPGWSGSSASLFNPPHPTRDTDSPTGLRDVFTGRPSLSPEDEDDWTDEEEFLGGFGQSARLGSKLGSLNQGQGSPALKRMELPGTSQGGLRVHTQKRPARLSPLQNHLGLPPAVSQPPTTEVLSEVAVATAGAGRRGNLQAGRQGLRGSAIEEEEEEEE